MPQIAGKLADIFDIWVSPNGEAIRLNLAIGEHGPLDLELTPQSLLGLLSAIEDARRQSEVKRDASASSGHPTPHPFLPVQTTETLQVFEPDRIGVRIASQNRTFLDFLLTLDGARALRDQLDTSLAPGRPPGFRH